MSKIWLLFCFTSSILFAQSKTNTRDFFPPQLVKGESLFQRTMLESDGVFFYNTYEYFYENVGDKLYLLTKTFGPNGKLGMLLREEVSEYGLIMSGGYVYKYEEGGQIEIPVKTKRSITYPFLPIEELKGWKSKTKAVYGNKVVITSNIEFWKVDNINGREVLFFKRFKKNKYSGDYDRMTLKSAYSFTFDSQTGLSHFYHLGKHSLEYYGKIVAEKKAPSSSGFRQEIFN